MTLSCDEKWSKPEINPYVFTMCTTYQDQMRSALKFVKDRAGDKSTRVAFSYPDIPFGQSPLNVGRASAQNLGLPLVGEAKVGAADVDAQSQALALKSQDPDYVVVQNVTGGASAIVRSARQVGLRSQFVGLNYAFDEATIKAIGPQAAEGYIGVGPSAFPGPDVGMLREMSEHAPNLKEVNMRAIVGWTLASVVADALQRADSYDSQGLLKALEQTDLDVKDAIPGGRWTYTNERHVPTRKSVFYQVTNGKIMKIPDPIDPPGLEPSMLRLNDIRVRYDDVVLALDGISIVVPEGHIVALLGANGAWKSTTLKAISVLLRSEGGRVTSGKIELDGQDLAELDPRQYCAPRVSRRNRWRVAACSPT